MDIARGSAIECAAIQDVLVVSVGLNRESSFDLKCKLLRIVAMLTKTGMKFDGVSESLSEYNLGIDYEHEHRDAERVESTPRPRCTGSFVENELFLKLNASNLAAVDR